MSGVPLPKPFPTNSTTHVYSPPVAPSFEDIFEHCKISKELLDRHVVEEKIDDWTKSLTPLDDFERERKARCRFSPPKAGRPFPE